MDTCSSGEGLVVKTRKPYTITKQRERWTEEEHNRFLEALRLYGRAWQRIEEHIGTKTAIQIRSHAQKFFSKLEKEALIKGIPLGEALDIDIPPPRPKRKPSNPYPRKTCIGVISSSREGNNETPLMSVSSSSPNKDLLQLERDPPFQKLGGTEILERKKDAPEKGKCSEVITLLQDTSCTSVASLNGRPGNPVVFREFVPLPKDTKGKSFMDRNPTLEENKKPRQYSGDYRDLGIDRLGLCINSRTKPGRERSSSSGHKRLEGMGMPLKNKQQGSQKYPNHVLVHVKDGNHEKHGQVTHADQPRAHASPTPFTNPSSSTKPGYHTNTNSSSMPSIHQQLPIFPPFTPFCSHQDAYRSFLNISPTFSNLILSALLQNPVAHAAASLAASFWPSPDAATSMDSTSQATGTGRHMSQHPSMDTIVAATVAVATAWWEMHGLFPLCHPSITTGFAFASPPVAAPNLVTAQANRVPAEKKEGKAGATRTPAQQAQPVLYPESPKPPIPQHSASKTSPLSPSESDECGRGERSTVAELEEESRVNEQQGTGSHDLDDDDDDKARNKKKQDRSSCGSNASSSSAVETDAVLVKQEENKEEQPLKETQTTIHPPAAGESSGRRSRSSSSANESWKEVSEEGRLAFEALFSREVLPQSFSPPHTEDSVTKPGKKEKGNTELPVVDLNSMTHADSNELDRAQGLKESPPLRSSDHLEKPLSMASGAGHGKPKARPTGFEPYKRCSMEAKEREAVSAAEGEEKRNKRIRLEPDSMQDTE